MTSEIRMLIKNPSLITLRGSRLGISLPRTTNIAGAIRIRRQMTIPNLRRRAGATSVKG
jgi:hypothetical protein